MDTKDRYYLQSLVMSEGLENAAEILGVDRDGLEAFLDYGIGGERYDRQLSLQVFDVINGYTDYQVTDEVKTGFRLLNNLTDGQINLIYDVTVNGRLNDKGEGADFSYFLEGFLECLEDLFEDCNEFWARFREFYKG